MKTLKTFIKTHPLLTYFALTFAISWGAVLIMAGGIPVTTEQLTLLGLAMLLGPSVASILLTGLTSGRRGLRELLSRLLRWRVSVRWYAVALLTAPFSMLVALFALALFSDEFPPAIFTSDTRTTLVLSSIAAGLMVGFFEELGWTGFAIPRMRLRYGMLATGLGVGILWGAWHFLLFWERDSFSKTLGLALLLVKLFSYLPAYRLLMVWVCDHTESLLVAMLMHVSLVTNMLILEPPLTGGSLLTYILVRAAVLWVVVALVSTITRQYQATYRSER